MNVAVTSELPERHRKWQPYPAYKDSGVEWLRRIPASWEAKRLKFLARLSYGDSLSAESREGGEVQVFGSNGPVGSHSYPNTLSPALIIGRKGSFGKVNFSDQPCFAIDTTYFIDARNTKENLRWLFYSLELLELDAISEDSAVPGLSREFAHEQWLPVPSLPEQGTIVAFLDRETAKIDTSIAKKERLIELLQEKRAAIISHAVTKGLDPDVPMKNSGIEWLGKIPAHREVKRLKYLVYLVSKGTTPTTVGVDFANEGIRFIKAENISDGKIVDEPAIFIDTEVNRVLRRSILQSQDLLMVIAGATTGKVGVVEDKHLPANTNQAVAFVRPIRKQISRFLYYWLGNRLIQQEVWLKAVQAAQPNLSLEDIRNFIVPVPSDQEIQAIVGFLDIELGKLDAVAEKIREGVEKLKEYRTALISAAVTGKIDVRAEFPGNDHANASANVT